MKLIKLLEGTSGDLKRVALMIQQRAIEQGWDDVTLTTGDDMTEGAYKLICELNSHPKPVPVWVFKRTFSGGSYDVMCATRVQNWMEPGDMVKWLGDRLGVLRTELGSLTKKKSGK